MANHRLARLESALRARSLDRTLMTALPLDRPDPERRAPFALDALDGPLQGGLPRGQLSEISGPHSSGRTTVLLQALAAATRRGELAALVDVGDRFDVASAVAARVDLGRLLWIRGRPASEGMASPSGSGPCPDAWWDRMLDRGVKAANLILQARGFGVVALDLGDVPIRAIARLPFTTWLRLQRAVEGGDTVCVLLVSEPLARSAGGLTLSLGARPAWRRTAGERRRLSGLDIRVRLVSPRHRVDGEYAVSARVGEESMSGGW